MITILSVNFRAGEVVLFKNGKAVDNGYLVGDECNALIGRKFRCIRDARRAGIAYKKKNANVFLKHVAVEMTTGYANHRVKQFFI